MPDSKSERGRFLHERGIDTLYSKLYDEWFRNVFRIYIVGFIMVVSAELLVGAAMGKYSDGFGVGLMYSLRRVVLPSTVDFFLIMFNLEVFHGKDTSDSAKNWTALIVLVCIAAVLSCVHNFFAARFAMFIVPVVAAMAFADLFLLHVISAASIGMLCVSIFLPVLWGDLTMAEAAAQVPTAGIVVLVMVILLLIEHLIIKLNLDRERVLYATVEENIRLGEIIETDELTGLYNRKGFIRRAQESLRSAGEGEYVLLLADIENFRGINERVGEREADELLRYMARMLPGLAPEEGSVCGRYAGDQFVLLIRNSPPDSAEGLRDFDLALRGEAPVGGVKINYGLCRSVDGKNIVTDCEHAKLALQSVKNQYGKFFAVYEPIMSRTESRRRMIEESMNDGIENHHFEVWYQPKHDTSTGELIGAEALVRWRHPEYGMISPAEFIPVLENNGFVTTLDRYVWDTVCGDLRAWLDEGLEPVPVSVNASRRDFLLMNDLSVLTDPVERCQLDRKLLHVEVTESLYTEDAELIIPRVKAVRDAGFSIEMDDFGSGYSSLGMLHRLPIDILKLDISFIRDIENQKDIVETMIYLARTLQLKTVAEGVENEDELNILRDMGCDYIQGYYFSRPLPRDEFREYLKKHAE